MKLTLLAALTVLPCTSAFGIVILTENFDYPDGDLVGNGGWTAHSGAGAIPIQVSSGAATLVHGSGSREDAGVNFGTRNFGLLVANFQLTVTDDAAIAGTDSEYFAHFMEEGNFNFAARLDVVPAAILGDFTLGLSTLSSTAEVIYGTDLTFGTAYDVELSFDIDGGLATLSVNGGQAVTSTTLALGQSFDRFALRQSNSSSDETITVDNLKITQIPEPSVALLGGLALLFGLRRRR